LLEEEKLACKQHQYKAKNSVLRAFRWRRKEVYPVVLAVAFWAATEEKEARKTILKAIIKDGFEGELQAELEKDVVRKKRFKVFYLARLSDLESKFNSETLGSIAHCEPGLERNHQGLLPTATKFTTGYWVSTGKRSGTDFHACRKPTLGVGVTHAEGNTLKEGVHRYVKAVLRCMGRSSHRRGSIRACGDRGSGTRVFLGQDCYAVWNKAMYVITGWYPRNSLAKRT
jgi:hypothetical protein